MVMGNQSEFLVVRQWEQRETMDGPSLHCARPLHLLPCPRTLSDVPE